MYRFITLRHGHGHVTAGVTAVRHPHQGGISEGGYVGDDSLFEAEGEGVTSLLVFLGDACTRRGKRRGKGRVKGGTKGGGKKEENGGGKG